VESEFLLDGESYSLILEKKGDMYQIKVGDKLLEADIQQLDPHTFSFLVEGNAYRAYLARDKDRRLIQVQGHQFELIEPSQDSDGFLGGSGRSEEDELRIKAPMPGKVIKICVDEGDEVRKNQTLVIVEAMKMENEIKAALEAVVKKIYATAGDLVDTDIPIIELEPK
jgi:biotin carboxyl carrier protein